MSNKLKCFILSLVCSILAATSIQANGGGTYAISSVSRSSNPIFRTIKDITLLSEKLYIKLNNNGSDITVKYILWNNSDKDYMNIDYAFPVDYIKIGSNDYPENTFDWRDDYMTNLYFEQEGKLLPHHSSEGVKLPTQGDDTPYDGSLYRKWFYTKLDVKKQSFITLEVNYSLANKFLCDGTSPLLLPILDGCTMRELSYDFSPASHWGDGIIRDFYVEIDYNDIVLEEGVKPRLYTDEIYEELVSVKGFNFVQSDNKFTYRQQNLDLKTAIPLNITYFAQEHSSIDIITKLRTPNSVYTIKSSSQQAKYPASNLADMNLGTAWVPANKGGVGDWIEYTFAKPIEHLSGVSVVNGYWKNEDTYTQNNRIKRLKIEVTRTGVEWQEDMAEFWDFADKGYNRIYFDNFFHHADTFDFFDLLNQELPIEKIRLTILEVYPGSKYNDTCVSEILFFK